MAGCSRANAWIATGNTAQAIDGSAAIEMRPCLPPPREASRSSAALKSRTMSRAMAAAWRPSSVSFRERVVRENNCVPISRSMRRMDSLSEGWEMPSRSAAALKLSASAAATRISS